MKKKKKKKNNNNNNNKINRFLIFVDFLVSQNEISYLFIYLFIIYLFIYKVTDYDIFIFTVSALKHRL